MNAHELRAWYHGLLQSSLDQSLDANIAITAVAIGTTTTTGMLGIVIGRINPSALGAIRQDNVLSARDNKSNDIEIRRQDEEI
jgi:hypothetical protein